VRSLRKIPTPLRSMNLCVNDQFDPFCIEVRAVTKWSNMPENMSLGSDRVDRVRSLRKIPMRLHSTNMCINEQFGPFCTEVRAVMKQSETPQNMSLGSNGVDRVRSLQKIPTRIRSRNLCINELFSSFGTEVHVVTKRSEMPQNISLGSIWVDQVHSL
jgi:hypothetical protein